MRGRYQVGALIVALALAGTAWGEPTYTKVSATQVVTNTTLPANTMSVSMVNDGANSAYYRLFTNGETAANAASATSAELKVGESISFSLQPGSTAEQPQSYYKTLSIICAAGETATVRVISK